MSGVSLELITTSEQREVAERLWQLYCHDLSEFRGYMPDSSGLYETAAARLLTYFDDPDRCGYLTYSNQALAGFVCRRRSNLGPLRRVKVRPPVCGSSLPGSGF